MRKNSFFILMIVLSFFVWGCKGGSSSGGGGSSVNRSALSYSNYNDLYTYNASALDGHTVRWETPIMVYTGGPYLAHLSANKWGPLFTFNDTPISSPVANAISILPGENLSSNTLGRTTTYYYTSGKIYMAVIYLNPSYSRIYPQIWNVISHEVGHAIGFFGHTSDGGLMDATYTGSDEITSTVRNVISLLYSLPIGTDIRGQLGFKSMPGGRYQPNGTGILTKEME